MIQLLFMQCMKAAPGSMPRLDGVNSFTGALNRSASRAGETPLVEGGPSPDAALA
jgi:hypothetical protein